MSFDMNWLWSTLSNVSTTIQTFFAGIWGQVSAIANTGQGIFAGMVAFGAQIWDGIAKLGDSLEWVYKGFVDLANIFGSWLAQGIGWVGSGINWVGTQVYNFGNWIWNGIQYGIQYLWAGLQGVWDAVMQFFGNLSTSLFSWWGAVTTSLNTWWTSVIVGIRSKIKQSIMASITISMTWKAGEKFLANMMDFEDAGKSMKGMGGSFLGMLAAPVIGAFVAEVINAMIPTPTTSPLQIVPTISVPSFTLPSISITPPTVPAPPISTPTGQMPITPPAITIGQPTAPQTYSLATGFTFYFDQVVKDISIGAQFVGTPQSFDFEGFTGLTPNFTSAQKDVSLSGPAYAFVTPDEDQAIGGSLDGVAV